MSRYLFVIHMLWLAVLVSGTDEVKAEGTAEYYKAGDVGVFAVDVEIPPQAVMGQTAFSVRSDNEKVYLLWVRYPQAVLERMSEALESPRPGHVPSAEQDKMVEELMKLYEEQQKVGEELAGARSKVEGLKSIAAEAEKEGDREFLERTRAKIKPAESEVARLEARKEALEEEMQALHEKQSELWESPGRRAEEQAEFEPVDALRVLGRFQGSGKVGVEVLGRDAGELLAEPEVLGSVELNLPSADGGNADLLKQWAAAQGKIYSSRVLDSPYTSYYQYWLVQARQKYDISESLHGLLRERRWSREGPDLYAMTTGALAIQESLQLEEMTGRGEIPSERDVPINSLKGPDIKSHPFDKMLAGRTPKMFPVAGLIPYDNYYCHFSSISKEIAASDLFKQWGASLLRALTVTARDSDLVSRYTNQLGIDLSILTRLFGDLIIGEVALTGGDPFVREGTDIALIIEVKSRKVFDAMMKSYAEGVLRANSDARACQGEYEGVTIDSIATGDQRVSSHSAYLGNYKVYSNCPEALRLIIDTFAKRRKSMADNLDFQYMRTIFAGTAEAEDGFIYLSDAFIRKLLSPRWKIEAQRRIICQNHLRMIANAATMYRTEMRRKASIETLVGQKWLQEGATKCPDGGSYSLDDSGRASCSVHNCLQYCTPVSKITFDQVAKVEAEDYKRFVRQYNDYWSRYFDPIGVRLRLRDVIEVETCILPLIENSVYNQLRELIGGEPVQLRSHLPTEGTVVSITAKLPVERLPLEGFLELYSPFLRISPTVSECFGNNMSLNFYDSDVLFTFAEDTGGMFGGWIGLEEQLMIGLAASSINLPIYAVLDLKDEGLAQILVRRMVDFARRRAAAERLSEFPGVEVQPYSWGQYRGHRINTVAVQLFVVKFRLHYAIASGRLIVSTKRYVLEKALDSLAKPGAGGGSETVANLQLNIRPGAFDKLRPIVKMGWQERMRSACLKNLEPVRVLVECHGATEQTLNEISRRVEGVTVRCPSGGVYRYDKDRSIVYCSVHGDHSHPRQPVQVKENEGLLDFIGRMKDFCVQFRFTEEGIMTRVAFEVEPEKR